MNYSAVLFDLDGTVLENEQVYAEAFAAVLKNHGITNPEDSFTHSRGIGLEANWQHLHNTFGLPKEITINQLVHETQDEYHKRLNQVLIRDGFFDFHDALKEQGIATALATSNNWWIVEDELEDLDLQKYFNTLVTGEEVDHKKPAPDIFLTAARKLEIEPEECIVIEDSIAGIEAAKEAGMKGIAILNFFSKREDFPKADLVVEGFEDLNPQVLDGLY
jgi:HAD superfamily hydrolase (TIGR01509 family)